MYFIPHYLTVKRKAIKELKLSLKIGKPYLVVGMERQNIDTKNKDVKIINKSKKKKAKKPPPQGEGYYGGDEEDEGTDEPEDTILTMLWFLIADTNSGGYFWLNSTQVRFHGLTRKSS